MLHASLETTCTTQMVRIGTEQRWQRINTSNLNLAQAQAQLNIHMQLEIHDFHGEAGPKALNLKPGIAAGDS